MRRTILLSTAIIVSIACGVACADLQFRARYGVSASFPFSLYQTADPNLFYDTAPASADCNIVKNHATVGHVNAVPTAVGHEMVWVASAAEMAAKTITMQMQDAAGSAFMSQALVITTYADANAWDPNMSVAKAFTDIMVTADVTAAVPTANQNGAAAWTTANGVLVQQSLADTEVNTAPAAIATDTRAGMTAQGYTPTVAGQITNASNDTNTIDTAAKLRTLLTGGNNELATEANMPLAASWTPTRAGYLDYLSTGRVAIDKASKDGIVTAYDTNGLGQYWTAALAHKVSDTDANVANIQTRLPAALSGGKMDSNATVTATASDIAALILADPTFISWMTKFHR